jgi:co-chaperonin GroES (HSP10)
MAIKKLLHNLVVVKEEEMEALEKSGLSIPSGITETPRYGTAVHVGTGCADVKQGDKILWKPQAGEDIYIDQVLHLLMTEKDVVAIV